MGFLPYKPRKSGVFASYLASHRSSSLAGQSGFPHLYLTSLFVLQILLPLLLYSIYSPELHRVTGEASSAPRLTPETPAYTSHSSSPTALTSHLQLPHLKPHFDLSSQLSSTMSPSTMPKSPTTEGRPRHERRPSTSAPISDLAGPVGPESMTRPKHKRTLTGFGAAEIKHIEGM